MLDRVFEHLQREQIVRIKLEAAAMDSTHGECDIDAKEQTRVQVLNSLLAEQIALDQAAELMGVSTRHARRITTAYREEGAAALAHGHRGHRPVTPHLRQ